LAYGTHEDFQRKMTNCERLEYMKSANIEGVKLVEGKCYVF